MGRGKRGKNKKHSNIAIIENDSMNDGINDNANSENNLRVNENDEPFE